MTQPEETDFSELEADAAKTDIDNDPAAIKASREKDEHPDAHMQHANGAAINSPAFLTSLVRWHPAVGSFQFLADCHYPKDMKPHLRFTNYAESHQRLLNFCIIIDFIVMVAVLIGLAFIASRVAWITLFD